MHRSHCRNQKRIRLGIDNVNGNLICRLNSMRSDKVAGETSTQGHFVVTASVKRCDTKTQEGRYSSR